MNDAKQFLNSKHKDEASQLIDEETLRYDNFSLTGQKLLVDLSEDNEVGNTARITDAKFGRHHKQNSISPLIVGDSKENDKFYLEKTNYQTKDGPAFKGVQESISPTKVNNRKSVKIDPRGLKHQKTVGAADDKTETFQPEADDEKDGVGYDNQGQDDLIDDENNNLDAQNQNKTAADQALQAANQNEDSNQNKVKKEWWPMRVGKGKEKQNDVLEQILNNNDHDVYPMSLQYSPEQRLKIKIIRFTVFIVFLYLFVPFDLYIRYDSRIGYYGTQVVEENLKFSEVQDNFHFILLNCKAHLRRHSDMKSMQLEYGFEFGVEHSFNSSVLYIAGLPTQNCIVNIYFPTDVLIPPMIFNFSGNIDNIIFDDQFADDASFKFSNLTIQGDTCFVNLNNHEAQILEVSLIYSLMYLTNFSAKSKNVDILTGLYSEYLGDQQPVNSIQAFQRYGFICLYGPHLQNLNKNQCDSLLQNFKPCTMSTLLCNSNTTACSMGNQNLQRIQVSLVDGPIQIRYPDEAIKSGNMTFKGDMLRNVEFNTISGQFLNTSTQNYILDAELDRLSVLQTIGVDYQRTWAYTNRKVLIESQFWPLTWGSGTLLRPSMDYNKLVLVDNQCPARKTSQKIDVAVKSYYFNNYPQTANSMIAFVSSYSQFYDIQENSLGQIKVGQITIDRSPLLIVSMGVAGIIAICGSALMVRLMYFVYKYLFKRYNFWIQSQKSFAITKRQCDLSESKGIAVEESVKFEFESKQNVLEIRGIFTSRYELLKNSQINNKYAYKFSLFQIPTLYIDFNLRRHTNSLQEFIHSIPENYQQFSNVKMKMSQKSELSITLIDFQNLYSDFCTKMGYTEINIERDGLSTLATFNIISENQEGQEQMAYQNIRFKTSKEKATKSITSNQQNISSIAQFLNEECVQTQFDTDYIQFDDMKKAYLKFCQLQGKTESQQEQIIGSQEVTNFGSTVKPVPPPMRLLGVKYENQGSDDKNLIRKPSNKKISIFSGLMKFDSVIPNVISSIVHFTIIVLAPAPFPIILYIAFQEMTKIQEDVFAKPLFLQDLYISNRLDPWWNHVPNLNYFLYANIIVVLFVACALLELVNYNLTGFSNNGRFPVMLTTSKKLLKFAVYTFLGIFCVIYFAMFWFVLVWTILAAVLNPNRFLPYAAAAMTLFTTIGIRYIQLKLRYLNMKKNFDRLIEEKINLVVEQSVSKLRRINQEKVSKLSLPENNQIFQRELNSYFERIFETTSRTILDQIKDGNITSISNIARIASAGLGGLQSTIIELSVAVLTKNKLQINDSLQKLSQDLNVDYNLLESVAEITLNDYDPDQVQQEELLGQAEIQIKKLYRKLVPNVNVDPFGDLLQVTVQGNTMPIIDYLEDLKKKYEHEYFYRALFKIFIYTQQENIDLLKRELLSFIDTISGLRKEDLQKKGLNYEYDKIQSAFHVFKILQNLSDGDVEEFMNDLNKLDLAKNLTSHKICFDYNFPVLFLSAFTRAKSTFTTSVINQGFKEILHVNKMLSDEQVERVKNNYLTKQQTQTKSEKMFLAFYIMLKGETMDMDRLSAQICKKNPQFQGDIFEIMHLCSTNSSQSFKSIIYCLDCASDMDLLMEFYQIINHSNVDTFQICSKIGLSTSKGRTFLALINILHMTIKYEILFKKRADDQGKKQKLNEDEQKQSKQKFKAEFSLIRNSIYEAVCVLDDKADLDISTIPKYKDMLLLMKASEKSDRVESQQSVQDGESDGASVKDSEGSEKQEQEQQENDGTEEVDEDAKKKEKWKFMIKQIFNNPTQGAVINKDHINLFKNIMKEDKLKKKHFNEKVMTVAQCFALIMIRNDLLINQTNKSYNKCVRRLAEIFDIELEKFDFMIDLISGNPLDVFKVTPKSPSYRIFQDQEGNFDIKARFDPQRMLLLGNILDVDRHTLQYACVLWHHYYRFFKQAKFTMPLMMKICGIKQEFFELMEIIRLNQSQKHSDFNQFYVQKKIRQFLVKGIEQSRTNQQKTQAQYDIDEKQSQYSNYFIRESEVKGKLDQNMFVIPAQEETFNFLTKQKQSIIEVITQLLRVKTCKIDTIGSIFNLASEQDFKKKNKKYFNNDAHLLQSMLIGVQNETSVDSILNLLYFASKQIPMFKKPGALDDSNDIDWTVKKLGIKKDDRNLFIQLAIILSAAQFQNLTNSKQNDKIQLAKALYKIVKLFNQAHHFKKRNNNAMEAVDEQNYNKILATLFQSNYFSDIAHKMFKFLGDQKLSYKQCNAILGLLLGASIQDQSMIRFSVITMLDGHVLNLQMLDGLAAALVNDITTESQLKFMCKNLDLNAQYLIDMIDFVEKRPQNLSSILFSILQKMPADNVKECASLIHLMKGEIAMCKAIAERINVEPKKMMPVLSAATGNLNIMGEFYDSLSVTLNLNSLMTVQYISELAHGKTSCIYKLQETKTNRFTIYDPELVEALYRVSYYGKQVQERAIEKYSEINQLENSLLVLSRKLSQVLQYPNEEAQRMNKFLITIVKACWNDPLAINSMIRSFNGIKDQNSVWCDQYWNKNVRLRSLGHNGKVKFIKRMLKKILDEYKEVFEKIDSKRKFFIKQVKSRILPWLRDRYQQELDIIAQKKSEQEVDDIQQQLDEINLGAAFKIVDNVDERVEVVQAANEIYEMHKKINKGDKSDKDDKIDLLLSAIKSKKDDYPNYLTTLVSLKIGCTFGASLYNSYTQPFYYCLTCNEEVHDESNVICVVCALHCHKGHKLQVGAYGIDQKMYCDCGGGSLNGCSELNKNNPVNEEFKNIDAQDIEKVKQLIEDKRKKNSSDEYQKKMDKMQEQKLTAITDRNKRCRMLVKSYEAFQEQVIEKLYKGDRNLKFQQRDSKDQLFINENEDNYTPQEFIADLVNAYNLPDYFEFTEDSLKENNNTYKKMMKIGILSVQEVNGTQRQALTSKLSNLQFTLAENIILMALGYMTPAFLTIFSTKKKYKIFEFKNQQIYNKGQATKSESVYRTMSLFTALAKVHFQKIIEYGDTICDALGESGNREMSAMDKICNVLMLSRGGKLPPKNSQNKKSRYYQLFKKIFGNKAEEMMVLNKLLQLPPKDVVDVLGLDQNKQNQKASMVNIKEWVDSVIFNQILRLDKNTLEYFKNVVGFSCANRQCFDYVVREIGIPIHKAQMYKALLTSDEKELLPIFVNLKMMIPINFNQFMYKVWRGDRDAITKFIIKFFEVNNSIYKEWKGVNFNQSNPKDVAKMKYLCHIYDLMSGDAVDLKKSYETVITSLIAKNLDHLMPKQDKNNNEKEAPNDQQSHPYMKRLMHCFTSLDAIFCNSVIDVPEIAYSLKMAQLPSPFVGQTLEDKKKVGLLKAVVNIVNKTWSNKDIKIVVRALTNYEQELLKHSLQNDKTKFAPFHERDDVFVYYRSALQAMDGDLIALAKIDDELINPSNTHINSLLASLMTGSTKFDMDLSKSEKIQEAQMGLNPSSLDEDKKGDDFNLHLNATKKLSSTSLKNAQDQGENNQEEENENNQEDENDIEDEDNSRPPQMNLLVKEIYRIYEKIVTSEYSSQSESSAKVPNFLKWSYNQKVPLYLLMVFSEQKLLIDKLFDIGKELSINLKQDCKNFEDDPEILNKTIASNNKKPKSKSEKQKRFIDSFVNFVDPFTQNTHMKTLMKQIIETKVLMMPVLKIPNSQLFHGLGDIGLKKTSFKSYEERNHKIYGYLKEELQLSSKKDAQKTIKYLELDLIAFTKLLANCYLMDTNSIKHLYLIFVELYDDNPILQNIFTLIYKVLKKDKASIYDQLPAVITLITKLPRQYVEDRDFQSEQTPIQELKLMQVQSKGNKIEQLDNEPMSPSKLVKDPEREAHVIILISKWMQSVAVMLDKNEGYSIKDRRKVIADSIQSLQAVQDEDSLALNTVAKVNKDQSYLVDIVMGLISLCKTEFEEMKPLALKVGGFPDAQKLHDFFFIINKNKDVIGHDSSRPSNLLLTSQEGMITSDQDELSAEGMNPRQIFNYFSRKNQGKIGIEEFAELCKYMGLNLSNSTRLQIFARVDLDKSGNLEFTEFIRCLAELKQVIINQSIEQIGLTINDLVSSFAISITVLLMTFVFIFISIQAFSTTTTFSSVTNSILPIISGGAVNRSARNQNEEQDEDLKEVVDENMT